MSESLGPPIRIASGQTPPGATAWQVYSPTGILLDVDTRAGNFAAVPVYVTSLGGSSNHWSTTGKLLLSTMRLRVGFVCM
jgi:hypothetical protein